MPLRQKFSINKKRRGCLLSLFDIRFYGFSFHCDDKNGNIGRRNTGYTRCLPEIERSYFGKFLPCFYAECFDCVVIEVFGYDFVFKAFLFFHCRFFFLRYPSYLSSMTAAESASSSHGKSIKRLTRSALTAGRRHISANVGVFEAFLRQVLKTTVRRLLSA